jgi:hypothetical protein
MKPRLDSIRPAAGLLWLAASLVAMAGGESPAADWADSRQL